jgi:hypothetical protein
MNTHRSSALVKAASREDRSALFSSVEIGHSANHWSTISGVIPRDLSSSFALATERRLL